MVSRHRLEERSFDHSTFSANRARLIEHDTAKQFFCGAVVTCTQVPLGRTFTINGTLIEAWASFKSLKRKDGQPPRAGGDGTGMVDFRGEKRTNATHESSTDPEAKVIRKGNRQPAKLELWCHALMENHPGLLIDVTITDATLAEPMAAAPLVDRRHAAWESDARVSMPRSFTADAANDFSRVHRAASSLTAAAATG